MPLHDGVPAIQQAIQLSIAPVFLLTGIAGLLAVMANRLARIIDRARDLERRWSELEGVTAELAEREIISLERRRSLASWAINSCTCAALLICLVIVTLFVGEFVQANLTLVAGAQFVVSMICLIGGLTAFLAEVYMATHTSKIQAQNFKRPGQESRVARRGAGVFTCPVLKSRSRLEIYVFWAIREWSQSRRLLERPTQAAGSTWRVYLTTVRRMPGALLLQLLLLGGCASLPGGKLPDPQDPFERFNRAAFTFNDTIDGLLIKPVAVAYNAVTPAVVQQGVTNFFANLSDVPTALNDLLQAKPKLAAQHLGRFAVNTTFGLLGVVDLATRMGIDRQREDFGQTLGRWGIDPGPYLVLPILGPSSVRDTAALPVDLALDPLAHISDDKWRISSVSLRIVQRRTSLLKPEKAIESIVLDKYTFLRDAYLARRRSLVYDGDPPDSETPQEPPPTDERTSPAVQAPVKQGEQQ